MKTVGSFFSLAMILNATALLASDAGPVSQAWAVRIDGPTNAPIRAAGMAVGPSGDVFLAGHVPGSAYNLRDIVITRSSSSGTLVWQRRYEPPEGPSANEVAAGVVAHGTNVYVAGSITSANDGNPDFLTLKYRDNGELEWAVRSESPGHYNHSPSEIAVDGQGNVLLLGHAYGTTGGLDIVVLKYGPSGNLLWTYSYDNPQRNTDRALRMRVDAAGNVYVAGTSGLNDGSAVVTFKLDPDGRVLWAAEEIAAVPHSITARSLDIDSAGNVVIVAVERWSYAVTWKYDANGVLQWMARYRAEEPASMSPYDVRFDGSGKVIAAANLYGSGTNDTVLIKYDVDGQQLWATRISHPAGTAHLNALDLDSDGNSYLTTTPHSDVVTVKVSPEGAQLWSVTFNSQGFFTDYGEFLEVTPSGDIFVAGHSTYFSQAFVSLVKYTQELVVTGVATAVVTPALQVVDPGTNVVFTAETIGPGPIHFQWRMNGRPIPDAANSTLALSNVQAFHRGDYSVIISNATGVTVSPEARLSVRVPPEVVIAPTQTLAYVGMDTAFQATVSGNDFTTLQWRHNGTNIFGATNETLQLVSLSPEMAGSYDIVVSTFGGTATSSAAGLRISRAVELIGTTPHRSSVFDWEYTAQLSVRPDGESFIAASSNHLTGSIIVLHKHAPNGEILWTAAFESAEFTNAAPTRLVLDDAGNIFIAAVSRHPNPPGAFAVLKYASDGQLLWSRILTGTNFGYGIHAFAVDPQGNSVLAVLGTVTSLYRYNHAGDLQWSYVDPSRDNDSIAVAVDGSGNTYLGATLRIDNGADNQIRVRKFDSTGAIAWTLPDADGRYNRLGALAVDGAGHLIVVGTGDLPDVPDSRMFVQKYASSGQKLWETRTGSDGLEIGYIAALAVGPGDDITVLNRSDDDYPPGEESGVTRIGPGGQLKYRISEPQILVFSQSQLALDAFGNAYLTGWGHRPATGVDAATAKYDAYGHRQWLVYYSGPQASWQYGIAVAADAAGDIRALSLENIWPGSSGDFRLLHYRQRDPASTFRLQLIAGAGGTFHLITPAQEPFRIQASADLQTWDLLTDEETQQLLQPGATSFADSPKRFFRLVLTE